MKDQDWNYLVHVAGTHGEGTAATPFQQRMYANTLLVAFQELLDLDLKRFVNGNSYPGKPSIKYDQAKIIYQPSGQTIARTRNYLVSETDRPLTPGLYLEVVPALPDIEAAMGVKLGRLQSRYLPEGILRLGFYHPGVPLDFIYARGVDQISDVMMQKRMGSGQGIYQLEVLQHNSLAPYGLDQCYHYDSFKAGMLALTRHDLTGLSPMANKDAQATLNGLRLSYAGETLIAVEKHSEDLAYPVPFKPGIFYAVPHKDSMEMLGDVINLSVLPHFERDRDYFQIATLAPGSDQPTFLPGFAQLKAQFLQDLSPALDKVGDSFALEFHYQTSLPGSTPTGRAHFNAAADAMRTLSALEPSAFDKATSQEQVRVARADLLNLDKGQLVATMFKASAAENGLPAGIYIMIDKQALTPDLKAAMGPMLSSYENGDKYHFLLAQAGDLASQQRKHNNTPRTLHNGRDTGKHY